MAPSRFHSNLIFAFPLPRGVIIIIIIILIKVPVTQLNMHLPNRHSRPQRRNHIDFNFFVCGSKRKCKTNENWQKKNTIKLYTASPCIRIESVWIFVVCALAPDVRVWHTRDTISTAFARDPQKPALSREHVSLVPKNKIGNPPRCRPTCYVTIFTYWHTNQQTKRMYETISKIDVNTLSSQRSNTGGHGEADSSPQCGTNK